MPEEIKNPAPNPDAKKEIGLWTRFKNWFTGKKEGDPEVSVGVFETLKNLTNNWKKGLAAIALFVIGGIIASQTLGFGLAVIGIGLIFAGVTLYTSWKEVKEQKIKDAKAKNPGKEPAKQKELEQEKPIKVEKEEEKLKKKKYKKEKMPVKKEKLFTETEVLAFLEAANKQKKEEQELPNQEKPRVTFEESIKSIENNNNQTPTFNQYQSQFPYNSPYNTEYAQRYNTEYQTPTFGNNQQRQGTNIQNPQGGENPTRYK